MQRIEIKHFGPITDLQLDIKDFMLFIGPQASGKSTIAKAIWFFKSLNDDFVKYFKEKIDRVGIRPYDAYAYDIIQKFLNYFGKDIIHEELALKYIYNDDIWIEITYELENEYNNSLKIELSKKFTDFIYDIGNESSEFLKRFRGNYSTMNSTELLKFDEAKTQFSFQIKEKCNHFFDEYQDVIFIHAGRSLLTQGSSIESNQIDDLLMRTFFYKIKVLKPLFNKSLSEMIRLSLSKLVPEKAKLAEELISKVLKGTYQYDKNKDEERIYYDAEHYVKLRFSSSGQQESLWILLQLFLIILEEQKVFLVIEEPEAHLFPEAQKEISALIALVSNMQQSQVLITTHSPYILASINNLILANKVGNIAPEEVSQKVNPHLWINRDKVYAALVQRGKVSDIIDKDWNLIQQEQIDTVSRQINEEFDYLYQYDITKNDGV
jgi:AAA15 family ATPase/GTPase